MIKLHTNDGQTQTFDVEVEGELDHLLSFISDKDNLKAITGIGSLRHAHWDALTKPKNFRDVSYHVESVKLIKDNAEITVGEKIICHADDIQLTILVYYKPSPKMTRIELRRIGKRRFVPKRSNNGFDPNKDK